MASDEDYQAFLDKAGQDVSGGASNKFSTTQKLSIQSVNTEVPPELEKVEEYFVSDADEPFAPVSLKYSGSLLPSAGELADLLQTDKSVATIDQGDFDPRGQYTKVVEAVKSVGGGELAFYRVDIGSTRKEYFVLGVDSKAGRIVGLKAKAIES